MCNVVLNNGRVKDGASYALSVEVKSGMSGKQLAAWKKRNEKKIVSAIDCGDVPCIISDSSCEESKEGDTCKRVTPSCMLFYLVHNSQITNN